MSYAKNEVLLVGPRTLPDEPPGWALEKHEKGKKATHLHVFLLKKTPSATEVLRFSTHEGGPNLQRRATHTLTKELG